MALYEYLSEKFPDEFDAIMTLAHRDPALRATLADYEELSTWMAVQEPTVPRDPDELERARKLARELEYEILNHLARQDERIS